MMFLGRGGATIWSRNPQTNPFCEGYFQVAAISVLQFGKQTILPHHRKGRVDFRNGSGGDRRARKAHISDGPGIWSVYPAILGVRVCLFLWPARHSVIWEEWTSHAKTQAESTRRITRSCWTVIQTSQTFQTF